MINFVTTRHGLNVRLDKPDLSKLRIETIGVQLAKMCRFNGACEGFYSVARHSRYGALAVQREEGNAPAKAFLMHDAHEIITGDQITPVARHCGQDRVPALKFCLDAEIANKWDIDFGKYSDLIKAYDHAMLYHEWRWLMPGEPEEVGIACPEVKLPSDIIAMLRYKQMFTMTDADRFINLCCFWGME